MEHYCKELKYDFDLLKNFGVYIHDGETSIIFEILESQQIKEPDASPTKSFDMFSSVQTKNLIPGDVKMNQKIKNFIVFHDIFDSILETRELYAEIAASNPNIRFIIFNYPG